MRKHWKSILSCALVSIFVLACEDSSNQSFTSQDKALKSGQSLLASTAPRAGNPPVSQRSNLAPKKEKLPRPDYEPGVVLVKWRDDVKGAVDGALSASLGLSVARHTPMGVDKMHLVTEESVPDAVARLKKDPRVIYAEPNYRIELENIPDDPSIGDCWGLNNTGQTGGTEDADIDAVEAWDISIGSRDIVVAVLDTGVDYTHPDLAANMWTNEDEIPGNGIDDDNNGYIDDVIGWDFEHQTNDPMDDYGHGTHCSGTIGAEGNNGIGVAGVNWRVTIMPLRIIGGQEIDAYCLDAAEAIHYAVDNGARVMSCSWWTIQHYNQTLEDAVAYSEQMDVALVAAAGNDSRDDDSPDYNHWPSEWPYSNIIAVAATNHTDNIAYFSNFGPTTVDVGAPGEDILSTIWPNHGYETMSGTSMATPHVAGTVALMLSIRPELTVSEVKQFLFTTVDPIADLQGVTVTGGRINAFRTLQAISGVPLPPVALAGGNQTVTTGTTVTLDGSASFDPNQDPITYSWDFYPPSHSSASLDDATVASPRFYADVCGDYQAVLTVTDDGGLESDPDRARVYVRNTTAIDPVIETSHPYANNEDQTWTITHPGAVTMSLHFTSFNTENGYDFVSLSDADGNEWATYDGDLGEFNSIAIDGDTIVVHFTSDASVTRDGFSIDSYWWCDASNCPPGQGDCNDDPSDGCETDTTEDVLNCGWCAHVCNFPNASATCEAGSCQIGACDNGWTDCDGDVTNGCEADFMTDPDNCGACGTVCGPYPNATAGCAAGSCTIDTCDAGWGDCNGQLVDGCEKDVTSDLDNCGACGNVCSLDHAIAYQCNDGICYPQGQCSQSAENVESPHPYTNDYDNTWVITRSGAAQIGVHFASFDTENYYDFVYIYDANDNLFETYQGNLGAFDSVLVPGDTIKVRLVTDYSVTHDGFVIDSVRTCANGCADGWGDCDLDPANGCETDILTSLENCGSCMNRCGAPNTAGECVDGVCNSSDQCLSGWANCDQDADNGCEVDITSDASNCGGCGNECMFDNATATCENSSCQMGECLSGFADCNGSDTDGCESAIAYDVNNCGSCGNQCDLPHVGGQHCSGGICQIGDCTQYAESIETDHPYLPSQNLQWTIQHPGATQLEVHFSMLSVEPFYDYLHLLDGDGNLVASFDGEYTDLMSPPIPGDTVQVVFHSDSIVQYDGFIIDYTRYCDSSDCEAGWTDCDTSPSNGCEANTDADISNCGACGVICQYDHAQAICSNGSCSMGNCDSGYSDCNNSIADGCEIDTWGDANNCGSCNNQCGPYDHGIAACGQGTCRVACDSGFADCNATVSDGCEVNVQADPSNCGACGTTCDFANASGNCNQGTCEMGACDPGWGDCNNHPVDGCEIELASDLLNCGTCGTECSFPNATPACNSGNCELAQCDAGWEDCNSDASDGCEVQPNVDPQNSGSCGHVCDLPGTAENGCVDGVCAALTCDQDLGDCDGVTENGCETQLLTDSDNCGGCGQSCDLPNSQAQCQAGQCAISSCDTDFADCDELVDNGCETNTAGDVENCGACGITCGPYDNATAQCAAGSCAMSCDDGFGDCDESPDNGCEVQLGTDTDCAACGNDCSNEFDKAAGTCVDGACAMGDCEDGYADCDGNSANGCEMELGTDANCSECGDDCSTTFDNASGSCTQGTCSMGDCVEGFGDCDSDPANGCEIDLSTDEHCGACDVACVGVAHCQQDPAATNGWSCTDECQDADSDQHTSAECGGDDCDDYDDTIYPGATEICDDGKDNDCNGAIDAADNACDGGGDSSGGGCGCSASGGTSSQGLFLLLGLLCVGFRRRKRS